MEVLGLGLQHELCGGTHSHSESNKIITSYDLQGRPDLLGTPEGPGQVEMWGRRGLRVQTHLLGAPEQKTHAATERRPGSGDPPKRPHGGAAGQPGGSRRRPPGSSREGGSEEGGGVRVGPGRGQEPLPRTRLGGGTSCPPAPSSLPPPLPHSAPTMCRSAVGAGVPAAMGLHLAGGHRVTWWCDRVEGRWVRKQHLILEHSRGTVRGPCWDRWACTERRGPKS